MVSKGIMFSSLFEWGKKQSDRVGHRGKNGRRITLGHSRMRKKEGKRASLYEKWMKYVSECKTVKKKAMPSRPEGRMRRCKAVSLSSEGGRRRNPESRPGPLEVCYFELAGGGKKTRTESLDNHHKKRTGWTSLRRWGKVGAEFKGDKGRVKGKEKIQQAKVRGLHLSIVEGGGGCLVSSGIVLMGEGGTSVGD